MELKLLFYGKHMMPDFFPESEVFVKLSQIYFISLKGSLGDRREGQSPLK